MVLVQCLPLTKGLEMSVNAVSIIPCPPDLLRSVLPQADFADGYSVTLLEPDLTAAEAIRRVVQNMPKWATRLMRLRNVIGACIGLKPAAFGGRTAGAIGGFPVVSETPRRTVIGFDDKHLDFRIVLDVQPIGREATTVTLSTLVLTHNRLGRAYLALIMPFHRLIARASIRRVGAVICRHR